MEFRRFLSSVIGLTLVSLFVVACGAIVPPTPTPAGDAAAPRGHPQERAGPMRIPRESVAFSSWRGRLPTWPPVRGSRQRTQPRRFSTSPEGKPKQNS
jgi:hypothetical protein